MKRKILYIYPVSKEVLIEKGVMKKVIKKFLFLDQNLDITFLSKFQIENVKSCFVFTNLFSYIFFLFKLLPTHSIIRCYDTSIYSFIAMLFCKITRKKLISSVHGHLEKLYYRSKLKRYIRIIIEKLVLKGSYCVICASKSLLKEVQSFNKNALFIPTWGVDSELFLTNSISIENKHYIIFVGRINPVKNLEKAIESFLLSNSSKKYKLLIIGPIDDKNYYKILLNKYEQYIRDGKIEFTGGINQQRLYCFYLRAKCLIMTSYTEGTPHPVLEALSLNVPVLSSKVGDIPEIIMYGKNGFYFDINDDASKIAKLLDKCVDLVVEDTYGKNLIKNYYSDSISNFLEKNLLNTI